MFWILRNFVVDDNEDVDWLFVLSSNLTMLGPVIIYWVSIVLIPVGWVLDGFDTINTDQFVRYAAWVILAFVSSVYQIAWIDNVRAVYNGDQFTFEEQLGDIEDSVEDNASEIDEDQGL